jgi:eukaryotic-like serine/threonine-protein kinase
VDHPRRFELLRKLGSGTFGDVHAARDRDHDTIVAIKALRSADPDWLYRFKREFRTAGDLAHPNLAHLYELFCEDGAWYLTMELVDGINFDDHVAQHPDRLRASFAQLALGLLELHRAGGLHRDLKPSNALVEANGRVVVLDFGLALARRASNRTNVAGTPLYMAPELGLGWAPTEASDWYAFGVMLYQAITGELPFDGDPVLMLQRKLADPPDDPREVRPGCDPELAALALRLLDRDPLHRPGADEILPALAVPDDEVAAAARRHAPTAAVVGRARELAALDEALAAADDGPVIVALRGAPGIGKTALLATFLDEARKRGAQAYSGRCLELEAVPYRGLDGAIDQLANDLCHRRGQLDELVPNGAAALARTFPVLERVAPFALALHKDTDVQDPRVRRERAIAALRELVGLMSVTAPIALLVDDVQWISEDTAELLLALVEGDAPPHLVVLAFRDGEAKASSVLARLLAALAPLGRTPRELALAPLEHDAVAELLATQLDLEITVDAAHRETGGNPHLLWRLAQAGAVGGASVSTILGAELAALDTDARRLLEVVARAGGPITHAAACEAAGLRADPRIVERLRRRRLVQGRTTPPDSWLDVYHPLVRVAVLAATGS